MKSLKEQVVEYLINKLDEQPSVSKRSPIKFSTQEITEALGAYKRSVSREISELRRMGVINAKITNRLKGEFVLIEEGRFTRKIFETALAESKLKLEQKNTAKSGVRRLLNGIHTNLSKASSQSKKD